MGNDVNPSPLRSPFPVSAGPDCSILILALVADLASSSVVLGREAIVLGCILGSLLLERV